MSGARAAEGPGMGRGPGSDALLRVERLRTWFPIRSGILQRPVAWVRAVDGVDLEIPAGRTVALVGESGCGKTTVGLSILRLEEPREGRVWFEGVDLLDLPRSELRPYRRRLQIVFQDPMASLDPRMRIRDAIAEGMKAFGLGPGESERTDRVAETMRRVKLDPGQMDRYPHEFSGGQRQRICIARALAVEPKLIVCDEPTSALDVSVQAQILNLLKRLQSELGLSYLFITHDVSVVSYIADRVAVMYLGRIVEQGDVETILRSPAHPYTEALMAAVPRIEKAGASARERKVLRVEGDLPSPVNPPAGCHFHPRCGRAMQVCEESYPAPRALGEGHSTCCHLYD
jgi:peptide/nickel transport system ATP-binding protein